MPALHCLIEVQPLDTVTGQRIPVRLASANLRQITGLGDATWWPALTDPPAFAVKLFDGDFSTPVSAGAASFTIKLDRLRDAITNIDRLNWPDAQVSIYVGQASESWPWRQMFAGRITATGFARKEGDKVTLTAEVDGAAFETDLLTKTYNGDNGSGGGSDLNERVKPLVIGWAKNVAPVLIDATYNVYQFSGYGPIEEVTELFERGASFGSPVANYSSYNNLVAATIANGKYATCLAEGMVRLGAPQYGIITGDVKGHAVAGATPRLTGAVIRALADIAGVSQDLLLRTTFDALDSAVPRNINLFLDSQASFIDMVRRLALPCNAQAGVWLTGELFAIRPDFDRQADLYLEGRGRSIPVVKLAEEMSCSPPFAKTVMGGNRNWRVQTADELAFTSELIDKGAYNASVTYREGNYVSLPNGAKYLYINSTASAGHDPPNGTYWALMSGGIDGVVTNIIYRKNATQPATPSASSGVPSGWVDDYASLPATDLPVWACFGQKVSGGTTYAWEAPYPMLADLRTYAANDSSGNANPGTVSTPAVVNNAINTSDYAESSTVINFASGTKTTILSFAKAIAVSGSILKLDALIGFSASDAVDGYLYLEVLSGATIVKSRMNPLEIDCNGSSQLLQAIRGFFTGLSVGTYTVRVCFERFSSETSSTNGTYSLEATEQKK